MLPPPLQAERLPVLVRQAANISRDKILLLGKGGIEAKATSLNTIARCIWKQDHTVLEKILPISGLAREHLVVTNGTIEVIDEGVFRKEFEECRRQVGGKRIAIAKAVELEKSTPEGAKAAARRLHDSHVRLAKLWAPTGKVHSLAGIRLFAEDDGTTCIIRDPIGKARALQQAWSPTFEKVHTAPGDEIDDFLREHGSTFDFSSCTSPVASTYRHLLHFLQNSGAGVDGLPYQAYISAPEILIPFLVRATNWMANGQPMSLYFNNLRQVFIPKGNEEGDGIELIRSPDNTRPLGLKNTFNKLIAAATNHCIKRAIARDACHIQNGFLASRNFVNKRCSY